MPPRVSPLAVSPHTRATPPRLARGELTELEMVDGNKSAHVTYSDPKIAQQFLDTREHVVDGVALTDIKAVVPKDKAGTGQPTNKIFVGGTVC